MPVPSAALVAALALAGGAVAGVALERGGVVSPLAESEAEAVRADHVDALDCPDGGLVAALTRGDRIFATGRTEAGDWIEIRSPLDLGARAWLPAAVVDPDGGGAGNAGLAELPVHDCEREAPTTSTSTTSTTVPETTTTTVPETTTTATTEAPPETTTTTRPPRGTTTTPTTAILDQTPPSISSPTRSASLIFTRESPCPNPQQPTFSTISVVVTDAGGGLTVAMSFSFAGSQGTATGSLTNQTQQGSTFSGRLGPFPSGAMQNPAGVVPITVTIVATDGAGNRSQSSTIVDLTGCPPG